LPNVNGVSLGMADYAELIDDAIPRDLPIESFLDSNAALEMSRATQFFADDLFKTFSGHRKQSARP